MLDTMVAYLWPEGMAGYTFIGREVKAARAHEPEFLEDDLQLTPVSEPLEQHVTLLPEPQILSFRQHSPPGPPDGMTSFPPSDR